MSAVDDKLSAAAEFEKGIWKENPIFVQMLGMCPTLAVTNSAINALAMGLATLFVLIASSAMVAALRRAIPSQVRISTYIVIVATFVSVADFLLQAVAPDVHKELGAFIALIVVNCVILGRAEAFASKHGVWVSCCDAAGMGLGFTVALLCMGIPRELLGSGACFGVQLLGADFEPWVVMILPPGGFLTLGMLMLCFAQVKSMRQRRAASREGA